MVVDEEIRLGDRRTSLRFAAGAVEVRGAGAPLRFDLRDVRHVGLLAHDRVCVCLRDASARSFVEVSVRVGLAQGADRVDHVEDYIDAHAPGHLYSVRDVDGLRLSRAAGLAEVLERAEPVGALRPVAGTAVPLEAVLESDRGRWTVELDGLLRAVPEGGAWSSGLLLDGGRVFRADGLMVGEISLAFGSTHVRMFDGARLTLRESSCRFDIDGEERGRIEPTGLVAAPLLPEVLLVMIQLLRMREFLCHLRSRTPDGPVAGVAGTFAGCCGLVVAWQAESVALALLVLLAGVCAALVSGVFWLRRRATRAVRREFGLP